MNDTPRRRGLLFRTLLTGLAVLAGTPVVTEAQPPSDTAPRISIIIDDLGDQFARDSRAVRLPGAVSLAFLPHTPHSRELAEQGHRLGKDVLLHLPMESVEPMPMGPGAVTLDMTEGEFMRTVEEDLASIPHVIGINNHMGSLLTRHPGHMQWLMTDIKLHGNLFFVDSRTTAQTVAMQVALENQVPTLSRDVFLDDDPNPIAIEHEFARLLKLARHQGHAVAIGHPFHATLDFLERNIPMLSGQGIQLVPISTLIAMTSHTPEPIQANPTANNKTVVYYQPSPSLMEPPAFNSATDQPHTSSQHQ